MVIFYNNLHVWLHHTFVRFNKFKFGIIYKINWNFHSFYICLSGIFMCEFRYLLFEIEFYEKQKPNMKMIEIRNGSKLWYKIAENPIIWFLWNNYLLLRNHTHTHTELLVKFIMLWCIAFVWHVSIVTYKSRRWSVVSSGKITWMKDHWSHLFSWKTVFEYNFIRDYCSLWLLLRIFFFISLRFWMDSRIMRPAFQFTLLGLIEFLLNWIPVHFACKYRPVFDDLLLVWI